MVKSFSVSHVCGHGKAITTKVELPLRAEVVRVSELDEEPDYIVWLVSAAKTPHYVTTVGGVTNCERRVDFLSDALNVYLKTPEGQKAAEEYVRHAL